MIISVAHCRVSYIIENIYNSLYWHERAAFQSVGVRAADWQ